MTRLGLVAPGLDLNRDKRGSQIFNLAPLTFPALAALTPDDIEIEFIDERVVDVPYDRPYDLVGLTFVTAFAPRAYEIADRFREKGVRVVMGGPHASVLPREASQHADTVVVGEAEEVWGPLIRDYLQDRLQATYVAPGLVDLAKLPQPRLDLVPKEFTYRNSTLASKGCPFRCEFCFTNSVNEYRQRFRPVNDVVRDIAAMDGTSFDRKYFVFWDDNIVGDPRYARALFRAITPFRKTWAAAASVTVANDRGLIEAMAQAGCIALFVGMESINSESLNASGKHQNVVAKYRDLAKRLHDNGIGLTGAFVFGFDMDDASVFDRTLDFATKIALDCMTPAILTPLPGTPLYSRMEREGRIFDRNWAHYDYFHVVFEPRKMSAEKLFDGFLRFNQELFSLRSILTRLGRSRTQTILALLANMGYRDFYKRMFDEYQRGLRGVGTHSSGIAE